LPGLRHNYYVSFNMAAHAKLGPSAADRWTNCLASVSYIDLLADLGHIALGGSSVYADEGTAAHEVRELSLTLGLDPHHFVGQKIWVNGAPYEVTDEMAEFLQPGIDWIREHTQEPDVEIRVDLSPWLPGQFGTMDGGWITRRTLYASDLKYGAGEPVDPEENLQQMAYGLGYWHYKGRPDVDNVVICIDQPRAGGLKFWDTTLERLLEFGEECKRIYAELQKISAGCANIRTETEFWNKFQHQFKYTKKGCRWCPARDPNPATGYLGCRAYNKHHEDLFIDAFDDLDAEPSFQDPMTIDREKRYYIVKHAKEATKWLAAMHQASLEAALLGDPDPGSKAVIGQRGDRYLTDAAKAEEILVGAIGEAAYKPKQLIGITEIEKQLKPGKKKQGHPEAWEDLQKLVDQPDGKPILVPADDVRPAITPIADQFDDLD
jgi:hypothetical protein